MPEPISAEKAATKPPLDPVCSETTVISLTPIGPSTKVAAGSDKPLWLLDLTMPDWGRWRPGQFVMLRPVAWGLDPLWARPFSICMAEAGVLRIFFQDVGRGTSALTGIRPGDRIVIWGPLGTSLAVKPHTPTLLLAGGMGLAPFIGYARNHPSPENLHLVLGHRQDRACYPLELLPPGLSQEVLQQQTEPQLQAFVEFLERKVLEYAAQGGLVLACGPHPFLRAVHGLALRFGVKTQISLENRMACGVGACLGCVAEAAQGPPMRVCNQGPVFWATDIKI
jgi:dihydroorotate dehydrogenase electron transfer subunit